MKKCLIAGAIACAFGPAHAEEISTFDLGTIVVTPARAPQPLSSVIQNTTVITQADLDRAGQQTVPEILRTLGGVEIGTNGGPGQTASVFIRGANSSHTVVLVDGVRMDNVTTGTTALEHIPVEQIERIEILRGPGSSLYGADAIGGVIQIFTKKPKGSGFDGFLGAGSQGTYKAGVGLFHDFGQTQLRLRVGHEATDAFSASNPAAGSWIFNPDRDPYRNTHVSASVDHRLNGGHSLGLSLLQSRGKARFDAGGSSDPLKVETLQQISAYSRNRLGENWDSLLRLAQAVDEYRWEGVSYDPVRSTQDQLHWQNDVGVANGTLTAGIEYVAQRLATPAAYTRTSRHVVSGFGLFRKEWGAHGFQAAFRHDDDSQFGGHDTGSLGYGYRLTPAWRVSANLGTAFRAPNFAELYYPNFSNPDLRPERSVGGELGLSYAENGRTLVVTGFTNRIQDLIAFDWTASKPTCPWGCPVNIHRAKTQGLELQAATPLGGGFDLALRATLQKAVNADTGRRLPRRAETFGSLRLGWHGRAWRVFAETVANGDRFEDTQETPAGRMGGYGLVNLGAEFAANRELTWLVRWNNVFDKEYELARGYNTPGSNVFLGLRYQGK